MENQTKKSLLIAEKYYPENNPAKKLKKLGEEIMEFSEAILIGNEEQKLDEAGDVIYVLLHTLLISGCSIEDIDVNKLLKNASDKLEYRMKTGYYNSLTR